MYILHIYTFSIHFSKTFLSRLLPFILPQQSKEETLCKNPDLRSLMVSLPKGPYDLAEPTNIPKGKLTLTEALKVLGSHHHQPQTWTPEKIAQEYSLDLKDTKAVLEFFIPFRVELIQPKNNGAKRINAS